MTTWGAVHVGDAVRGADQRAWTVVGVDGVTHWINVRSGTPWDEARLTLRRDGREVRVRRPAGEPVDLVARADHGAEAAACTALLEAGLPFDILEERLESLQPGEGAISDSRPVGLEIGEAAIPGKGIHQPRNGLLGMDGVPGQAGIRTNERGRPSAEGAPDQLDVVPERRPGIGADAGSLVPRDQVREPGAPRASDPGGEHAPTARGNRTPEQQQEPMPAGASVLDGEHALRDAGDGARMPNLSGGKRPSIPSTKEGPVTDPFMTPTAEVKRDRWGRYLLPDPETGEERAWTRATTVARTLADEFHLTKWKMRMVAKGIALRPDLVAGAAAADPDVDKKTLDDIAEQAMERAGSSAGANLGTALHSFAQKLDLRTLVDGEVPEALHGDLSEYTQTLRRHRLKTRAEWIERIVVVPELGVAGTFDRIVYQPSGVTHSLPLAILDLKTAKSVEYMLEIAIQLAIYAHATHMWNPVAQAYEPMPEVDRDRALVLHLPAGKAHGQLYGVNLIEGWEYAKLAIAVREARKRDKGLGWLVEPEPEDLAIHLVRKAATVPDLAALWDRFYPAGQWTEEVNAAAAQRWEEINAVPATV